MEKIFSLLTSILWIGMLISPAVYAQGDCRVGRFGSSCQYKCHCTNNNCDNNGDCRDNDTCVNGWFGSSCQYRCYCPNNNCDNNGDCRDGDTCVNGWFGSSCQYKCQCTNNNCDNNGDCRDGDTCVKGWFGPQCQYVDLTYTQNDGTTIAVITDADDTTCNDKKNQSSGTVVLNGTFPFTWLRLHFKIESVLQDINLYFRVNTTGKTYQCNNKRSAVVNSRTIDIYCDVAAEVDEVTFIGRAIGYLCSVYVSGGRNVALRQSHVNQSSTYRPRFTDSRPRSSYEASNAVDGNISQDFERGSCTHTGYRDPDLYWNIEFSQISDVNRYVIYNRDGSNWYRERLMGFVLTSFDKNDVQVFQHVDNTTTAQSVYDIASATNIAIKRVNIIANHWDDILTLCEVETYGDSHCPAGKYGRECDHNCNCATNEQCFVSTGGCPSGCAAGYMGESCHQNCPPGQYGVNCGFKCSSNCKDQICSPTTGCTACKDGYRGSSCDMLCERGKYGQGCSKECSQFCNTVNGNGDNETPCHHVTGTCIYGCIQGYEGLSCESEKQSSSPGLSVWLGIGLGVAALIVIIGVAIYCYRRRSRAQRSRRQRPVGYDLPEPTTDEHIYSDLLKSADDYNLPTDMISSSKSPTSPPENIPQDTVQYANADVGHYEEIGQVTSNGESEEHDQHETSQHSEGGNDNACYANA